VQSVLLNHNKITTHQLLHVLGPIGPPSGSTQQVPKHVGAGAL